MTGTRESKLEVEESRVGEERAPRRRRLPVVVTATAVQGAALAVLLASTGSLLGRSIRVTLVVAITIGAIVGERGGGPRTRGTLATALGVVGTTVGLAVGVSHLARSGVSVQSVAGTITLATGAVLLVAGASGLIRAASGWRRWLALPIAFVVLQFVMLPLFVALLITNPPPTTVDIGAPRVGGLDAEDVRFPLPGTDGAELAGWYVPSRNGAAVVVRHGSGSTRADVVAQASVLADHGYGVLLVDARGHGDSDGSAMDTGWWGAEDTAAAVTFLQTRSDVEPERIGVLGLSMGGEEAVTAAAEDPRIRAVVAEGVGSRQPDDHPAAGGVSGAIETFTTWEQYALVDLLTDAPRPVALHDAVAEAAPTPVLLIAGAGEIDQARRLRDASPTNVEVWELADTAHTAGLATHPAEWDQRVATFFDRALLDPPGGR